MYDIHKESCGVHKRGQGHKGRARNVCSGHVDGGRMVVGTGVKET